MWEQPGFCGWEKKKNVRAHSIWPWYKTSACPERVHFINTCAFNSFWNCKNVLGYYRNLGSLKYGMSMGKSLLSVELKPYSITQWNCTTIGSCSVYKTNQRVSRGAAWAYGNEAHQSPPKWAKYPFECVLVPHKKNKKSKITRLKS